MRFLKKYHYKLVDFNIFYMFHSTTIIILIDNIPSLAIGSPCKLFQF